MRIAIATPMYGGLCHAGFKQSVQALARALAKDGGSLITIDLGNESLIERGRDALAWLFLLTDATHLLFCDADQGFRVPDIARMVGADKDIIVAPVPMKVINWERVRQAAIAGVPAEELHRYSGAFNIVPVDGETIASTNEPFEIKRGGAGLMLIKREVFDKLADAVEDYQWDCAGGAIPLGATVRRYFPVYVEWGPGDKRTLLSEDYGFCAYWRAKGGTIWCAPWCDVTHMGTYAFNGSYGSIQRLL